MKAKILLVTLVGGLLALASWTTRTPSPSQAYDVPEKDRETIHKGLEYLVKNQFKDGHWEGDGGAHPVAMTGLVGLALLMESDTKHKLYVEANPKYAANIRKAVDWLIDKSQGVRDGLIFSDHASETARYMEGHGLATLFLAGVCRDEQNDARRKRLAEVLGRAVRYIVKAQSSQGGWHHTSKAEGHDFDDVSATAIQIQALQAAANAGIPIPGEHLKHGKDYLRKALAKCEEPERNRGPAADFAAALACLINDAERDKETFSEKWFSYCRKEITAGRDDLADYYYAQVAINMSDEWKNYCPALFDHLRSRQNKEGGWPASAGIGVGPVYATALWCVVLQLETGNHPSRRRPVVMNT